MTARQRKVLLAIAVLVLVLLLPLTLITALLVMLSYPAYPIPDPGLLQILFDIAMVLQIAAIIAGWRLAGGYLRAGRASLEAAHGAWMVLLGIGAIIGLAGAGFAVEHAISPRTAADHVGFALLCPAVLLLPLWLLLWREGRKTESSAAHPPAG